MPARSGPSLAPRGPASHPSYYFFVTHTQIKTSLKKMRLPDTDSNAAAMLRYLGTREPSGAISYGQFRNFAVLLPPERLSGDSSLAWFESATMLPVAPPLGAEADGAAERPGGLRSAEGAALVLKSALAGALTSGCTTAMMHPLDTIKTRVQAASVPAIEVLRSIPALGARALYRGIIPASAGAAAMHGVRTGAYEATLLLLAPLVALGLPGLSQTQAVGLASAVGTALGTGFRIPCEVLKQRLQAGVHADVGEASRPTPAAHF